jgi:hypothetical protein
VHQFNTFSIADPLQHAIAAYLAEQPDCGSGISGICQEKRAHTRQHVTYHTAALVQNAEPVRLVL